MGPTRLSGTWTGLAVALVVLVLLLVFLLLNLREVEMNFYGAHVRAPLAVALLFAVVLGALLVFAVGAARILQVRVRAKRSRRRAKLQEPKEAPGAPPVPGPPPRP